MAKKNKLKKIPITLGIVFVLIITLISKNTYLTNYSCNNLTTSSFDLNLFKPDSTINLFIDNKLAKKANKLCIKQLAKDKNNPQFTKSARIVSILRLVGYNPLYIINSILFKKPTIYSRPLARLESGRLVLIKKCNLKWCKITTGDFDGWVDKNSLWGSIK